MCPDILACTPLAEAVWSKLLTLGRDPRCPKGKAPGGARAAQEAKVLISLKVSNLDQTATI